MTSFPGDQPADAHTGPSGSDLQDDGQDVDQDEGPELVGGLSSYAATASAAPILGHVVMYSIYDGRVKPSDLELWFRQNGLDLARLPAPIRPLDAYEKVTGPTGPAKVTYPLDGTPLTSATGGRRRRPTDGTAVVATLMVRPVRRDASHVVRHLVREVRDERATELTYDTRLATLTFHRDTSDPVGRPGAGTMEVAPDHAAINGLPEDERALVYRVLDEVAAAYDQYRTFLTGDKLRSVVRAYIEALNAVRVRPTGGAYFVHREHAETLSGLRKTVARMGEGSHLVRIPIPDQDEMREMVINAFTTRTKDELEKLSAEIARAQSRGAPDGVVQDLYTRFRRLSEASAEHSRRLSTSLAATEDALNLVKVQLGSLLAAAD